MGHNFDKNTCDVCGITKEENEKNYKEETPHLTNYQNKMKASFRLGFNEEVWCPKCYKEIELEKLFVLMDKREKKLNEISKVEKVNEDKN